MTNVRYLSDKELRPISFKIDPRLYTKVKIICADQHLTIKKFFEIIVEDYFKKHALPKYLD